MNRRQFLVTGAAVTVASVAGCLADGEYSTEAFDGTDVPLAPTADVYEWYEDEDVRIVDARTSEAEYDALRITDAVFSPAPDGVSPDDPTEEWSTDTRIATYCICPHALAGHRAASLIDSGYEDVYAIDEGLEEWVNEGHPVEGEEVNHGLPSYDVSGRTDQSHAGEYVWVREPEAGQSELSEVAADGSFEMTLHFVDIAADTVLEVETPGTTTELTLAELTSDTVTV